MFAFLIFQFYSGSITSSILQAQPDSIKSLRDLIESPLQLAVEDIIYTRDFFYVCVINFATISEALIFQTLHLKFIPDILLKFFFFVSD